MKKKKKKNNNNNSSNSLVLGRWPQTKTSHDLYQKKFNPWMPNLNLNQDFAIQSRHLDHLVRCRKSSVEKKQDGGTFFWAIGDSEFFRQFFFQALKGRFLKICLDAKTFSIYGHVLALTRTQISTHAHTHRHTHTHSHTHTHTLLHSQAPTQTLQHGLIHLSLLLFLTFLLTLYFSFCFTWFSAFLYLLNFS